AALRHGRWDEARAELETVRMLSRWPSPGVFPWLAVQTRIDLTRAYLALRETSTARSLLAEIRHLLEERPYLGVLADEADALEREVDAVPSGDGPGAGLTGAELRLLPLLS